ncbi:MAG: hypothetical protein RMJ98_01070 [Myxococcales bacterium]|nr:hypothetical protein [Polyangiaceae bacterium]MDW8247878.1 hypothetical protein [Myxococcales bacterium]
MTGREQTLVLVGLLVLGGCKEQPAANGSRAAPVASSAAPVASSTPPVMSHVAPTPGPKAHPDVCEVEFFGQVKPVDPKLPPPVVFVSYTDCLAPTTGNIGQTSTQPDGKFFLEVFVKWGSDLTLCAFQPTKEGAEKPTKLYGKAAGPFHAEKEGEVEFKDVQIELKNGTPQTFPRVRPGGGL